MTIQLGQRHTPSALVNVDGETQARRHPDDLQILTSPFNFSVGITPKLCSLQAQVVDVRSKILVCARPPAIRGREDAQHFAETWR
jgi:hypothetical protein